MYLRNSGSSMLGSSQLLMISVTIGSTKVTFEIRQFHVGTDTSTSNSHSAAMRTPLGAGGQGSLGSDAFSSMMHLLVVLWCSSFAGRIERVDVDPIIEARNIHGGHWTVGSHWSNRCQFFQTGQGPLKKRGHNEYRKCTSPVWSSTY